jgi:hypothetical protein
MYGIGTCFADISPYLMRKDIAARGLDAVVTELLGALSARWAGVSYGEVAEAVLRRARAVRRPQHEPRVAIELEAVSWPWDSSRTVS